MTLGGTFRRATVVRLFLGSRPAAILWGVGAVIVDTVNRVLSRGLAAHVGDEGRVIVAPAVADGNTAATVLMISGRCGPEAASVHAKPRPVFSVPMPGLAGIAVDAASVASALTLDAPATQGVTVANVTRQDYDALRTAIAAAKPPSLHFRARVKGRDGQFPGAVADQIHDFHRPYFTSTHDLRRHG